MFFGTKLSCRPTWKFQIHFLQCKLWKNNNQNAENHIARHDLWRPSFLWIICFFDGGILGRRVQFYTNHLCMVDVWGIPLLILGFIYIYTEFGKEVQLLICTLWRVYACWFAFSNVKCMREGLIIWLHLCCRVDLEIGSLLFSKTQAKNLSYVTYCMS